MIKSVIITGITGKSGRYFLKEMIDHAVELQGINFRLAIRESSYSKIPNCHNLDIEKVLGDLEDERFVKELVKTENETMLFHIAGIDKSLQLVQAALQNDYIKRIVLVHTSGIYSKYKSASKVYEDIESEIYDLVRDKNICLTILRPTMIYGTLDDNNVAVFIKMVDRLKLFPTVNGAKYELQPVWCGDLGKAYFQVMMHEKETRNRNYILSGGSPIMLIDMFHTIENYLGKKNIYISVPFCLAYAGAILIDGITMNKKNFREKVQRLVEPRKFDHCGATQDFGFNPVTFDVGVMEEIKQYIESRKIQ